MRRLLYSLVFVSVLLLAGFAGVRAGDVPGDTVPDGDYQMWLPVVDNNYIWSNEYSMCPWRVAEVVLDGIAYSPYATMTYTIAYKLSSTGFCQIGHHWCKSRGKCPISTST